MSRPAPPDMTLRPLAEGDLGRTLEWLNRPDISAAIGVRTPITAAGQQAWFRDLAARRDKRVFAICRAADGGHIGNVSLDRIEPRHGTARLAIFIADGRGAGAGSRALSLLARHAFGDLGLVRLWCKTTAGDDRVIRFYQRLGFQVEGRLRGHEVIAGRRVDKILLGLLADEFVPY